MRRARGVLVAAAVAVAGCQQSPRNNDLLVAFEPPSLADRVAVVVLTITDVAGAVSYEGAFGPAQVGPRPRRLGAGAYVVTGVARDARCLVQATGTIDVELPSRDPVIVTLTAAIPSAACAARECMDGYCFGQSADAGPADGGPHDGGRDAGFDAGPCEPLDETCNGADDDCDDATDEDFDLGADCSDGTGACLATGTIVCDGPTDTVCSAGAGTPGTEACNDEDDDCDGSTDEDFMLGSACNVGQGICRARGSRICDGAGAGTCDATPGSPDPAETCNGQDDDCDGTTDEGACMAGPYPSCAVALAAGHGTSGTYLVDAGGSMFGVYCDMTTDDGGWTLVASTRNTTLNDESSAYYADLATLAPAGGHTGVWNGLRSVASQFDVRFTCRNSVRAAGSPFDVDLSFYDVVWYGEFTTGTDAMSCFSEGNGAGADPPPARRDNVAGTSLPAGDPWNTDGYFEGEDTCSSSDDFTVDFDDRGMDSNESDGTDWGEDDGSLKCGTRGLSAGQWFIFVRE